MIQLVFKSDAEDLGHPLFGDHDSPNAKHIWIFPDIKRTFPAVIHDGKVLIDPSYYYITSGEALRKTEVLISDIKNKIEEYNESEEAILKLGELLGDIMMFYEMLLEAKGPAKYLEVTKSEGGIYNGNICARKDKKKKKKKK